MENKLQYLLKKILKNQLSKKSKLFKTDFKTKEDYVQFIYDKLNLDTKKSKIYTFKVDDDKELGSVLKKYLSKQIDIQLAAHCCMVNKEPFIGITLIVTKK